MDAQKIAADLPYFTGTTGYHRWSILFPQRLTDGAKYIAEECGAYWLMDAIASYQRKLTQNEELAYFQLWELTVKDNVGVLTCRADSDKPAIVTQKFKYTAFPLPSIKFYVENGIILLPSEH